MTPTPGMTAAARDIVGCHQDELWGHEDDIADHIAANVGPEIESRDKRIEELQYRLSEQTNQTLITAQQISDQVNSVLQSKGIVPDGISLAEHSCEQNVATCVSSLLQQLVSVAAMRDAISNTLADCLVSLDAVGKERDAALARAEQAEAEAAAMREAIVSTCCMPDDTVCILGSKADREILQRALNTTAGRELLDELKRLRHVVGEGDYLAFDNSDPPQLWSFAGPMSEEGEPIKSVNASDGIKELKRLREHNERLEFAVKEALRCCLPSIFGVQPEEVTRLCGIYEKALASEVSK